MKNQGYNLQVQGITPILKYLPTSIRKHGFNPIGLLVALQQIWLFSRVKTLKKVLKTVEKFYFKSPIDPWEPSKYIPSKKKF